MILIPSIDLRAGRCVRLLKGNFDAETRYDLEPHELLLRYRALGANWLHVVDLDGAKDGQLANRSVIVRLASQRALNIQVGGGVRSQAVVDDLLRNGIDRVIVGSAAVETPAEVQGWLKRYGAEKIGLAFDIRHDAAASRGCSRAAGPRSRSSRSGKPSNPICRTASGTCCVPTSNSTAPCKARQWRCMPKA